jgi:hypothetical protein
MTVVWVSAELLEDVQFILFVILIALTTLTIVGEVYFIGFVIGAKF